MKVRIEIQLKKLEVSTSAEIPDIKPVRNIRIDLNHSCQPPELYSENSIRSRHKISIGYYEEEAGRRREIGAIECSILVLFSDESADKIHQIYDIWNSQGYNNLPLDVRVALENNISLGVLPAVSVVAEKARLPPPVPPVALSSRPSQG